MGKIQLQKAQLAPAMKHEITSKQT